MQLVGRDIYEKLIKGYTEKQWGRPCRELPPEIIRRLPVRLTFDNNYFNAEYQGVPKEGYTALIEKLLDGAEVRCNTDYLADRAAYDALAERVVYTGCIDAFFDDCFGPLAYRRVRFETERLEMPNYQGNAVVNYTDAQTPYTRIIEHKHFTFGTQPIPSSAGNTAPNGSRGRSRIIPSTTKRINACTNVIKRWRTSGPT